MTLPPFRTTLRAVYRPLDRCDPLGSSVRGSIASDAAYALARLRSGRKLGRRQATHFASHPDERVAVALVNRAEQIPDEIHREIYPQLWDRALAEERWNPLLDVIHRRAKDLCWHFEPYMERADDLAWRLAEWLMQEEDILRSRRIISFKSKIIRLYFAEYVQVVDADVLSTFRRRAPGFAWMLEKRFPSVVAHLRNRGSL
jgi:hypothetical protein